MVIITVHYQWLPFKGILVPNDISDILKLKKRGIRIFSMTVQRALELVENRLKLCTKGIEELKQIQSTIVGSLVQDVTRIPLEMLEKEIEDLQEIKKELS